MRDKIMTLLRDLEKQHNIRILMAVNYGSRCFGYSSAESDWDVRFIYVHRPEWYFSIAKTEDVIEMMVEEEHLDIEGYDLKKALNLLARTNPIESDWLHANDYYVLDEDFLQKMLSFEAQCYNSHHAMYHFYSISVKHNQRYLDKEVTLKRFIYYMRGLLSCRWVEHNSCHPPVNVDELIDVTITDNENVREKAHRLLEMKRTGKSHDMEIVDMELSDYVFALQKYYEKFLPSHIDSKPKVDMPSMSKYLMKVVLEGKTTAERALDKYAVKPAIKSEDLDIERILSTGIPDLAQVYGGFRGRTLSSTRQLHAWNTMVESGISQIIDLRADYSSDFYTELCQRSGIGYFKYPVAYEDVWVAKMVELFPEFCKLIDKGRFYIACAMGLHRTDIALCTYWVFYAADKGIAPPPICGYRKDKGMNTNKIMRILNAMYNYMTEKNGVEPFPTNVFLERKEIIKEMSRRDNKMEDVFATTRSGRQLVDFYDPDTNTLDIRSNGLYPSGVLSNLCSNGFRFEEMVCGSMEGFLQSLKQKDRDKQRQICSMKGGNARKHSVTSWQTDQIVWWKGVAIDRQSEEYQKLLRRAYQAMFDQSERFRAALMQTRGITLVHSSGEKSRYKTILTEQEFCQILTDMRDNYDKRDKHLEHLGVV